MKITGMTTRIIAIDGSSRFGGGPIPKGRPQIWHFPLTSIHTDEDIDGYTMGWGPHGEGKSTAYLLHDVYFAQILDEDPLHHEAIWQKLMWRGIYALTDVFVGMLDVAFWDIKGKVAGLPIGVLLGLRRTKVPSYATGQLYYATPEKVFDEARRFKEEGYHGYKQNYVEPWDEFSPRLRAAREAVGPGFFLMADGGSLHDFTRALEIGHVLEDLEYHWFEEPIPDQHIGQLKRLTDELTVPVAALETVRLRELPEYLRQGAVDLPRGDVEIKGGITGLRKALAMCELFGYNLEIHTTACPLLDVANLHVACSVDNCEFLESHHPIYRFGMKNAPLDIDDEGYLYLPQGPGLGVELDWDWIDDHTVETITGFRDQ